MRESETQRRISSSSDIFRKPNANVNYQDSGLDYKNKRIKLSPKIEPKFNAKLQALQSRHNQSYQEPLLWKGEEYSKNSIPKPAQIEPRSIDTKLKGKMQSLNTSFSQENEKIHPQNP